MNKTSPNRKLPLRFWIITIILCTLILIRIILPFAVKWYINSTLQKSQDFTGKVDKVNMNLLRGAYSIRGISLDIKSADTAIPFISVQSIDFLINWGSLFKGDFVARGQIRVPEIDYTIGVTKVPQDKPVTQILSELFPFRIDLLVLSDGKVRVRNATTNPQYEINMTDIDASILNLTNSLRVAEDLYASMKLKGRLMKTGKFEISMIFNPVSKKPVFDLNATLTGLDITELNNAARAHAELSFEDGTFAARTQLATKKDIISGWIKPVFVNLQVLSKEDKNLLQKFWEGLTGAGSEVLEGTDNRLTTTIPITIPLKASDEDYFSVVTGALITAFGRAVFPDI